MKKLSLITLLCLSPLQAISEDFVNDIIMQQNEQEALETTRGLFGSQQNKASITGGELRTYIANYVEHNLKSQVETLPPEVSKELAGAIQTLANALGKEALKRKYNALSKEYVENVMQSALKKFFANANNYVDQSNVDIRVTQCIERYFQTAGITSIAKPEGNALYKEFSKRKTMAITGLQKIMSTQQRSYVTKQEIEAAVHLAFDGFIKRAQKYMQWQWVQSKVDDFKKVTSKEKALSYIPQSGKTKALYEHLKNLK